MDDEVIRLLSNLVVMFDDGNLKTRFDRIKNEMVNDDEVRAWVERARKLVPAPRIKDAAEAMRKVEGVDEAIAAAPNVTDLRKKFAIETAKNGGAIGLINQLIDAVDSGNDGDDFYVIERMRALRQTIETGVPPADA